VFRRRPSRDDLYRELLAEKDAQIALLRSLTGTPAAIPAVMPPSPVVDGQPGELGSATWESELDEAEAILQKDGLSQIHLAEILDGLGVGSSDLS
jgi:hypothetical protein